MKQYCNQLISGPSYIYYVVEYVIKNVMEIFSHSVLTFFYNLESYAALVRDNFECISTYSYKLFLYVECTYLVHVHIT